VQVDSGGGVAWLVLVSKEFESVEVLCRDLGILAKHTLLLVCYYQIARKSSSAMNSRGKKKRAKTHTVPAVTSDP
jgi:hypothetical protein